MVTTPDLVKSEDPSLEQANNEPSSDPMAARVRAQLTLIADKSEQVLEWSNYLVAFEKGNSLAPWLPADIADAVRIRVGSLKLVGTLERSCVNWLRPLLPRSSRLQVHPGTITADLVRRYAPEGAGVVRAILLRIGWAGVALAVLSALGGFLGKRALDVAQTIVRPAHPRALRAEGQRTRKFDAAAIRGAIADLWISKFVVDNLPGFVGHDCYLAALGAEDVPLSCAKSWNEAISALQTAQHGEETRMAPIVETLETCVKTRTLPASGGPVFRENLALLRDRPLLTEAPSAP